MQYRDVMAIDQITTRSPFKDFNPIDPVILKAIEDDMRKNGYDISAPIVLWEKGNVVIDGHTRLQAAKNAKLKEVDVCMGEFKDEEDARNFAEHHQRNRRSLTNSQIFQLIRDADQQRERGGDRKSADFQNQNIMDNKLILEPSHIQVAKELGRGIAPYQVQRVRAIIKSNDAKLCEEIVNGKKLIRDAMQEIKDKKHKMPIIVKETKKKNQNIMDNKLILELSSAPTLLDPYQQLVGVIEKAITEAFHDGMTAPQVKKAMKEVQDHSIKILWEDNIAKEVEDKKKLKAA